MAPPAAGLAAQPRAELFAKFAALERAGIPIEQALLVVRQESPKVFQQAVDGLIRQVRQGRALAEAGQASGVFLPWEARLIRVAAAAGKLERVLARLAAHYAARARRLRGLRARMAYPLAILVLATFVAPVPGLVLGAIGPLGYLARTVLPLTVLYLMWRLGQRALRRFGATEQPRGLAAVLLAAPGLGGLVRRQQERDFLASLALLLEAGVPAIEALRWAADGVANPLARARFAVTADAVQAGLAVAAALSAVIDDRHGLALIEAGEAAGRLDEMLSRQVQRLDERLDRDFDLIAEWLPRGVYALVVAFVVGSIL